MQNIYSLGEVARMLGIPPYKLTYAITTGLVPDASARFAGRRAFSEADVQKLAAHFGAESWPSQQKKLNGPTA